MLARTMTLVVLLLAVGCNGPLPFMSGGSLAGEEQPVPQEWALDKDFGFAQLETRPEDPYSVNVAYTLMTGHLYINAGDTERRWVKHMEANPLVRLRISKVIYPLRAERVIDPDEISRFGKVWVSQSMFYRDPDELGEVWIYRLTAR